MKRRIVDERDDVRRIETPPTYRVEFWTGGAALNQRVEAWDAECADLLLVVDWVRARSEELRPCRARLFYATPFTARVGPSGIQTHELLDLTVLAEPAP